MNTVDMVTVHSVASAMLVGLHRRKNATISHFLDATGTLLLILIARINIRGGGK